MEIIKIQGLKKNFGTVQAIKNIDLNIRQGEFFGLLGPNGAGKTTTINILSTILKPDAGQVQINGYDLQGEPAKCKKSIGIVPQELALYDELSAGENLHFWGRLYGLGKKELERRSDELLETFELAERKNDHIKTFSGGMKRRVNIAAALLHNPEILMMDEPTVGIDPQSRNKIYEVLEAISQTGVTIVYTTHYMGEVEQLCSRIGIIDHGEIIAEGTLEELRKITGNDQHIIIHYDDTSENTNQQLKQDFGDNAVIAGGKMIFQTHDVAADLPVVMKKFTAICSTINHISVNQASLESVFLTLTGRTLRD
jgi:ABC-2 type transport system ATP-binding protein